MKTAKKRIETLLNKIAFIMGTDINYLDEQSKALLIKEIAGFALDATVDSKLANDFHKIALES